jgi:hypothetical protein
VSSDRLDLPNQSAKLPDGHKEGELQKQNSATPTGNARKCAVCDLPVRVERANAKNPGNPFSYLDTKQRARKLLELWVEIARAKRNQH